MRDPQERVLVTVYRHKRKGHYRVQSHGYEDGFLIEIGDALMVSSTDNADNIASAVEASLGRWDTSLRPVVYSDPEYTRFRRDHDAVVIRRSGDGTTEVEPRQHVRGGYTGIPEEKIVLGPDAGPTDLVAAISDAFRRAG